MPKGLLSVAESSIFYAFFVYSEHCVPSRSSLLNFDPWQDSSFDSHMRASDCGVCFVQHVGLCRAPSSKQTTF